MYQVSKTKGALILMKPESSCAIGVCCVVARVHGSHMTNLLFSLCGSRDHSCLRSLQSDMGSLLFVEY
jgi:hypothetical protein